VRSYTLFSCLVAGVLSLSSNFLESSLPSQLGMLSNLTDFDIALNINLSGTLPTEMGRLTSMEWLQVWENKLTGSIPSEIGLMTRLTSMNLSENRFTGLIPTEIAQLSNMKMLTFQDLPLVFGSLVTFCENIEVTSDTSIIVDRDFVTTAYQVTCPCCQA